jgi:hypothetical protein
MDINFKFKLQFHIFDMQEIKWKSTEAITVHNVYFWLLEVKTYYIWKNILWEYIGITAITII